MLGVESTACEAEIRQAYKKLALEYHPDKYVQSVAADKKDLEQKLAAGAITRAAFDFQMQKYADREEELTNKFKLIAEALKVLTEDRAEFHRQWENNSTAFTTQADQENDIIIYLDLEGDDWAGLTEAQRTELESKAGKAEADARLGLSSRMRGAINVSALYKDSALEDEDLLVLALQHPPLAQILLQQPNALVGLTLRYQLIFKLFKRDSERFEDPDFLQAYNIEHYFTNLSASRYADSFAVVCGQDKYTPIAKAIIPHFDLSPDKIHQSVLHRLAHYLPEFFQSSATGKQEKGSDVDLTLERLMQMINGNLNITEESVDSALIGKLPLEQAMIKITSAALDLCNEITRQEHFDRFVDVIIILANRILPTVVIESEPKDLQLIASQHDERDPKPQIYATKAALLSLLVRTYYAVFAIALRLSQSVPMEDLLLAFMGLPRAGKNTIKFDNRIIDLAHRIFVIEPKAYLMILSSIDTNSEAGQDHCAAILQPLTDALSGRVEATNPILSALKDMVETEHRDLKKLLQKKLVFLTIFAAESNVDIDIMSKKVILKAFTKLHLTEEEVLLLRPDVADLFKVYLDMLNYILDEDLSYSNTKYREQSDARVVAYPLSIELAKFNELKEPLGDLDLLYMVNTDDPYMAYELLDYALNRQMGPGWVNFCNIRLKLLTKRMPDLDQDLWVKSITLAHSNGLSCLQYLYNINRAPKKWARGSIPDFTYMDLAQVQWLVELAPYLADQLFLGSFWHRWYATESSKNTVTAREDLQSFLSSNIEYKKRCDAYGELMRSFGHTFVPIDLARINKLCDLVYAAVIDSKLLEELTAWSGQNCFEAKLAALTVAKLLADGKCNSAVTKKLASVEMIEPESFCADLNCANTYIQIMGPKSDPRLLKLMYKNHGEAIKPVLIKFDLYKKFANAKRFESLLKSDNEMGYGAAYEVSYEEQLITIAQSLLQQDLTALRDGMGHDRFLALKDLQALDSEIAQLLVECYPDDNNLFIWCVQLAAKAYEYAQQRLISLVAAAGFSENLTDLFADHPQYKPVFVNQLLQMIAAKQLTLAELQQKLGSAASFKDFLKIAASDQVVTEITMFSPPVIEVLNVLKVDNAGALQLLADSDLLDDGMPLNQALIFSVLQSKDLFSARLYANNPLYRQFANQALGSFFNDKDHRAQMPKVFEFILAALVDVIDEHNNHPNTVALNAMREAAQEKPEYVAIVNQVLKECLGQQIILIKSGQVDSKQATFDLIKTCRASGIIKSCFDRIIAGDDTIASMKFYKNLLVADFKLAIDKYPEVIAKMLEQQDPEVLNEVVDLVAVYASFIRSKFFKFEEIRHKYAPNFTKSFWQILDHKQMPVDAKYNLIDFLGENSLLNRLDLLANDFEKLFKVLAVIADLDEPSYPALLFFVYVGFVNLKKYREDIFFRELLAPQVESLLDGSSTEADKILALQAIKFIGMVFKHVDRNLNHSRSPGLNSLRQVAQASPVHLALVNNAFLKTVTEQVAAIRSGQVTNDLSDINSGIYCGRQYAEALATYDLWTQVWMQKPHPAEAVLTEIINGTDNQAALVVFRKALEAENPHVLAKYYEAMAAFKDVDPEVALPEIAKCLIAYLEQTAGDDLPAENIEILREQFWRCITSKHVAGDDKAEIIVVMIERGYIQLEELFKDKDNPERVFTLWEQVAANSTAPALVKYDYAELLPQELGGRVDLPVPRGAETRMSLVQKLRQAKARFPEANYGLVFTMALKAYLSADFAKAVLDKSLDKIMLDELVRVTNDFLADADYSWQRYSHEAYYIHHALPALEEQLGEQIDNPVELIKPTLADAKELVAIELKTAIAQQRPQIRAQAIAMAGKEQRFDVVNENQLLAAQLLAAKAIKSSAYSAAATKFRRPVLNWLKFIGGILLSIPTLGLIWFNRKYRDAFFSTNTTKVLNILGLQFAANYNKLQYRIYDGDEEVKRLKRYQRNFIALAISCGLLAVAAIAVPIALNNVGLLAQLPIDFTIIIGVAAGVAALLGLATLLTARQAKRYKGCREHIHPEASTAAKGVVSTVKGHTLVIDDAKRIPWSRPIKCAPNTAAQPPASAASSRATKAR